MRIHSNHSELHSNVNLKFKLKFLKLKDSSKAGNGFLSAIFIHTDNNIKRIIK